MIRRHPRYSSVSVRKGVVGMALMLPMLSAPLQAQETPVEETAPVAEESVTSVEVEEEVEETVVIEEPRVLISEVLIVGLGEHPEEERLQLEAYEAMQVRPGRRVTRAELQRDLNAVQATGWFSDVRITPENSPLGVRVMVEVEPFPTLSSVVLTPAFEDLPPSQIEDTFGGDYGRTLNLNDLQKRMKELQQWFSDQGYSLARVSGPERVSPEGEVTLKLTQGEVAGIEVEFVNKEGETSDENGNPIGGKTKDWVVTREISIKPGDPFNRTKLESDIKRLYGTQLFSDIKGVPPSCSGAAR